MFTTHLVNFDLQRGRTVNMLAWPLQTLMSGPPICGHPTQKIKWCIPNYKYGNLPKLINNEIMLIITFKIYKSTLSDKL